MEDATSSLTAGSKAGVKLCLLAAPPPPPPSSLQPVLISPMALNANLLLADTICQ